MATKTSPARDLTPADYALCACGHERAYHDETHCSGTQRCACKGFALPSQPASLSAYLSAAAVQS